VTHTGGGAANDVRYARRTNSLGMRTASPVRQRRNPCSACVETVNGDGQYATIDDINLSSVMQHRPAHAAPAGAT